MTHDEIIQSLNEEIKFLQDVRNRLDYFGNDTAAVLLREGAHVLRSLAFDLEMESKVDSMAKLP